MTAYNTIWNPLAQNITRATIIALGLAAIVWALLSSVQPTQAAGVVGNGTPQSCTENAFISALNGGGSVTFNCGPNPTTISITLGFRDINQNTSIDGGGLITLDANHNSNIFHINAGRTLTLTGITLINGQSDSDGGCIYVDNGTLLLLNTTVKDCAANYPHLGGGIYDSGGVVKLINSTMSGNSADRGGGIYITGTSAALNVTQSTLSGNSATNYGGGIYNMSTVTLTNVTVNGNSASFGGGVQNFGFATLNNSSLSGNSASFGAGGIGTGGFGTYGTATLTNVTVSGNSASFGAGGGISIYNGAVMLNNVTLSGNSASQSAGGISVFSGTVTLNNSTLSRNSASQDGGGISVSSGLGTLTNSTLSGNSASQNGGGIFSGYSSTVTINNSTLAGNSASAGGGLYVYTDSVLSLKNSVIAYSPTGGNCSGSISSSQYSISSDNTCGLTGTVKGMNPNGLDPLLTGLGNYGGPTLVHMLKGGSPAIDGVMGTPDFATDQRGEPRSFDGSYDIGSVERQSTDSDLAPRLYLPLLER